MTSSSVFREGLLAGRHAFLTGGTSGIGLAIAERFAQHGAAVSVLGRKQDKIDAALPRLSAAGAASAGGHAADVRDAAAVAGALAAARRDRGEIDILVCGAAGNFPAPVLGMSPNGFKAVVDIDLLGTFNTCRAAYEHLRRPGASVLCISATHAFTPFAAQAHVCAAKSGVDMLARVLAVEWGPSGVRVNCLSPGPVDGTEGMARLAPGEEARAAVRRTVPLRRFASLDEIADLALFLSSPAAGYVTGAVIVADGGQCLAGHSLTLLPS